MDSSSKPTSAAVMGRLHRHIPSTVGHSRVNPWHTTTGGTMAYPHRPHTSPIFRWAKFQASRLFMERAVR